MSTISQLHTACHDCIFSVQHEQTQIGCKFDRIEKYKNAGAEVIPVYDDKENEFFVINNRSCLFKRIKEWGDRHPKADWEKLIKIETKIPHQAIIFHLDDNNIEDLQDTLDSVRDGHTIPNITTIVTKDKNIYELVNLTKKYFFEIRIKNMVMDDLHRRQMIDLVFDETKMSYKFMYYIIYDSKQKSKHDYTKILYESLHDRMDQIIIVRPEDKEVLHGGIYNSQFHAKHAGNSFSVSLEDKLLKFEDESIVDKIKTLTEVI